MVGPVCPDGLIYPRMHLQLWIYIRTTVYKYGFIHVNKWLLMLFRSAMRQTLDLIMVLLSHSWCILYLPFDFFLVFDSKMFYAFFFLNQMYISVFAGPLGPRGQIVLTGWWISIMWEKSFFFFRQVKSLNCLVQEKSHYYCWFWTKSTCQLIQHHAAASVGEWSIWVNHILN